MQQPITLPSLVSLCEENESLSSWGPRSRKFTQQRVPLPHIKFPDNQRKTKPKTNGHIASLDLPYPLPPALADEGIAEAVYEKEYAHIEKENETLISHDKDPAIASARDRLWIQMEKAKARRYYPFLPVYFEYLFFIYFYLNNN